MKTILLNKLRQMTKDGYVVIKVDNKLIREHIYIVENFISRKLKDNECVHHLNHNREDNRIKNLMLFKSKDLHKSFENKVEQFGYTNPVKKQIENRWKDLGV